jgi:predicted transcriptional regulator of viral defense system
MLPQLLEMDTFVSMVATENLPMTFTTKAALKLGLHPRELYRLRDAGELIELSRGVFRRADAPPASLPDLLAVAHRAPAAIVCCVSALAVHDLTDENPAVVDIAVPRSHRPPRIDYPPTKVYRFDEPTFEIGLTQVDAAEGEPVRIYSAERSVVDAMRLRHRLGEPLAHAALARYLRRRGSRPAELLRIARMLDVYGPVKTAAEIALAE